MVWSPDFASKVLKLKKRSDFYVGPFWVIGQKVLLLMPMELVKY